MYKYLLTFLLLTSTLKAQTPISSLPVATVANNNDVTVLVQSGVTKQLSVANLIVSSIPSINTAVTNTIQALLLAGANITISTNASSQLTITVSGFGTAASSNGLSFMAVTNATGIRKVNSNEAGMVNITPVNSTEWVINNDNVLHRATGSSIGNWDSSTSQLTTPGQLIVGGLYGASAWNVFRTRDILDYSTVIAYGSNSFDGFGWGDKLEIQFPHQEATLAIDGHNNSNIGYYQGNNYLQFNPRWAGHNNNSVTNPASFGISFVSFENGGDGQSVWNEEFYNGTNGDHILFAARGVEAHNGTMITGKEAIHIDATNGLVSLQAGSLPVITGIGEVSWTGAGIVSGSNTTFLTSLSVGDVLVSGSGAQLTIIGVSSDTNAVGFEVANNVSYNVYTIQKYSARMGGINLGDKSTLSSFVSSRGMLLVGGTEAKDNLPAIGLFNKDSRWEFLADTGALTIRANLLNNAPVRIATNAPDNSLFITSTNIFLTRTNIALGSATAPYITSGTGTPLNNVIAPIGSLYLRVDGGTSTTLYVKESGAGASTGWVAK